MGYNNFFYHIYIYIYIYYQINLKKILNRAKVYYDNNKKKLREQARNKYRELSEKEKDIKREHGRNRYKNMSEENKQGLKECQKNYRKANKWASNFFVFFSLHGIKWNKKSYFLVKIVLIKINFKYMKHQLTLIR